MSPALSDEMVSGMDDMADSMHPPHKPAARHSAFFWRDQPSEIGPQLRPSNKDRSANGKANRYSCPVEGREVGEKSTNKRHALIRGGI